MSTPSGGPAFPVPQQSFGNGITLECKHEGITIRDYFAAAALQGIVSQPDNRTCQIEEAATQRAAWFKADAEYSYQLADAMLAARNEGREG